MRFILDGSETITDDEIDKTLERWISHSIDHGVTCVFDAGIPEGNEFQERVYSRLHEMDMQGKLPVYIDGCYSIWQPAMTKKGIEELKRFSRTYQSEHLRVYTLKVFMDGTLKIETAALITPYKDTDKRGTTYFDREQISGILRELNEGVLSKYNSGSTIRVS